MLGALLAHGGVEHLIEGGGDVLVAPAGGVLVTLRSSGRGMTEAGHQLAGGGACLRRQGAGGVAEVVEVDLGEPCGATGLVPSGVEGGSPQALRARPGEDRGGGIIATVASEVRAEGGTDRRRQVHRADAGGSLGCGLDPLAVSQLDHLALDAHRVGLEVQVASAQRQQLAEAQTTEAGQQDQRPVAVLDDGGEG